MAYINTTAKMSSQHVLFIWSEPMAKNQYVLFFRFNKPIVWGNYFQRSITKRYHSNFNFEAWVTLSDPEAKNPPIMCTIQDMESSLIKYLNWSIYLTDIKISKVDN